jgi:nitrogen-specific signal transduction histidine kinase
MAENNEAALLSLFNSSAEEASPFKEETSSLPEGPSFLSPYFIELVSRMKKMVHTIKNFSDLSKGRFKDERFGEYFNKKMTEDTEKLDTVLRGLLDYVKVNTPVRKADTIRHIFEEVLRMERKRLEGKKIRISGKFERALPETTLHDEQIRYIFHSIFQYAFPLIPEAGSIGFLARSVDISKREPGREDLPQGKGRYIEVLILFSGGNKPGEPVEAALGIPGITKDDVVDLILRLVREIVQKNRGEMKLEFREKESKTHLTLRLPVEKRKILYYLPAKPL